MNEEERRQEILKAEEAIRQLAGEMASASESTARAEEVRGKLEEATTAVKQAGDELRSAAEILADYGEKIETATSSIINKSINAFVEARDRLNNIGEGIEERIDQLQDAGKTVEGVPQKLTEVLTETLAQADNKSMDWHRTTREIVEANSTKLEELKRQVLKFGSLVRWAVVLAAIAAAATSVGLFVALLAP